MGKYSNFIKDFPDRCNQLLSNFENFTEYEVTLMLAIAASGLTVPFERLKKRQRDHPSYDRYRPEFEDAIKAFDDMMKKSTFLTSDLCRSIEPSSWTSGNLSNVSESIDPWSLDGKAKPISPDEMTERVVSGLRNALAHGNIFTRNDPIDKLVFLSRKQLNSDEYVFYMVSPKDFRIFLCNWFAFLRSLNIPGGVPAAGVLAGAEI